MLDNSFVFPSPISFWKMNESVSIENLSFSGYVNEMKQTPALEPTAMVQAQVTQGKPQNGAFPLCCCLPVKNVRAWISSDSRVSWISAPGVSSQCLSAMWPEAGPRIFFDSKIQTKYVLVSFYCSVQVPRQEQLTKEKVYSDSQSKVQSTVGRKLRLWELGTLSHIASMAKKKKAMSMCAQLSFPY